jgi:ankyrin repeat protein
MSTIVGSFRIFVLALYAAGMPAVTVADTPLHRAARIGDVAKIRSLIEDGADVNVKTSYGETPLFKAAQAGHREAVELLLASGADVNAASGMSCAALFIAIARGHKDIAQILIENGADVNAKTGKGGFTPLHEAAGKGRRDLVELLIAAGANVRSQDWYHHTPLDCARDSETSSSEVVTLLIANGGDMPLSFRKLLWVEVLIIVAVMSAIGVWLRFPMKIRK